MPYSCPLCHQDLTLTERSYRCQNNHCFDLAKEGYINLMPVQHKRSKVPGDNQTMMQARRRFLDQNHYQPLQHRVAELCSQVLKESQHRLLDIGCGEGYYTAAVAAQLEAQTPYSITYGLDISKVAVRYAAKRYSNCHFSVASSHRLPFSDHSLDAILRIYAPCNTAELERVLTESGVVVTVTPASHHLYQLREKIYPDVKLHDEQPEQIAGFELIQQEKLSYEMQLTDGMGDELLQMTPFAWKASEVLRTKLRSTPLFACEADFMIRIYRKKTHQSDKKT